MRHASERGHLVIGLGDFNMRPLSLAHQLIETHSPVRDVWRVIHPHSSLGAAEDERERKRDVPTPSARYNLDVNGATCDSILNTWRWNKGQREKLNKGENITVDDNEDDPRAKRLDYIFVANGSLPIRAAAEGTDDNDWAVESVNVGMTGRHPRLFCSLSDHFSVETTLVQHSFDPAAPDPTKPESKPTRSNGPDPSSFLPLTTYNEILTLITTYTLRERRQRTLRIAHFFFQLFVTMGCLVAVWFSPRNFVAFLLMLLSSLGLAVGVTDGLMGFLFVGSEERALREFEWEIRNVRDAAEAAQEGNWRQ
jgi:sphingomyelin phosphodiesterase 2